VPRSSAKLMIMPCFPICRPLRHTSRRYAGRPGPHGRPGSAPQPDAARNALGRSPHVQRQACAANPVAHRCAAQPDRARSPDRIRSRVGLRNCGTGLSKPGCGSIGAGPANRCSRPPPRSRTRASRCTPAPGPRPARSARTCAAPRRCGLPLRPLAEGRVARGRAFHSCFACLLPISMSSMHSRGRGVGFTLKK
jgi:hypothetical protein